MSVHRTRSSKTTGASTVDTEEARSSRTPSQHERAAAYVREHFDRSGEWPAIKIVVAKVGVGTGTAWRASQQVRVESVANK